jgi:hypothetical protein
MIELTFVVDRETKNTVKFEELVEKGRPRAVVGSLYVLKADLDKMGWKSGDDLKVTINASA